MKLKKCGIAGLFVFAVVMLAGCWSTGTVAKSASEVSYVEMDAKDFSPYPVTRLIMERTLMAVEFPDTNLAAPLIDEVKSFDFISQTLNSNREPRKTSSPHKIAITTMPITQFPRQTVSARNETSGICPPSVFIKPVSIARTKPMFTQPAQ